MKKINSKLSPTLLTSKSSRLITRKGDVFAFIQSYIIQLKRRGRDRTSETYVQLLRSLQKYLEGNPCLPFEKITADFVEGYEIFLRQNNLCRNTTSFYMRLFRSICNRAEEDGYPVSPNPFKRVYTGIDKTIKRALSLDELRRIRCLDLHINPPLAYARDLFLFSFYTRGMSFIDIAYLKQENLSNGYLVYNRRKTGQQIMIRWELPMQLILESYPSKTEYLFPILGTKGKPERRQYLNKMQWINKKLKEVALLAGISTPLSLYVARHSWATIALEQQLPLHTISLAMGHDNEETTRIYLSSIQTQVIDKANSLILDKVR